MAVKRRNGTLDQSRCPLILVVDDDRAIREFLIIMLEEEGFATVGAGNGREALRIAAVEPPSLVVSDIMMPHLDGYELVAQLRRDPKLRSVPVILTTAARRARQVDVPLFHKPFDIDQLLAAIVAQTEWVHRWPNRAIAGV